MVKYEAVFGDQSLFYGAPYDAEFAANGLFYKYHGMTLLASNGSYWNESCRAVFSNPDAMRRIIKTPTWTLEDKKAGRLPEVGALVKEKISSDYCGYECIVRCIFEGEVCIQFDDGSFRIDTIDGIEPIETPREKYEIERDEWVNEFMAKSSIAPWMIDATKTIMCVAYESLKPFKESE